MQAFLNPLGWLSLGRNPSFRKETNRLECKCKNVRVRNYTNSDTHPSKRRLQKFTSRLVPNEYFLAGAVFVAFNVKVSRFERLNCASHDVEGARSVPLRPKTFRTLEGKARSAYWLLLRNAMHHATPLQHVLAVDAYRGALRIEPLYDIECDGVHGIVVFRNKHHRVSDVVVDIGTAETNVLSPSGLYGILGQWQIHSNEGGAIRVGSLVDDVTVGRADVPVGGLFVRLFKGLTRMSALMLVSIIKINQ